MRPRIRTVKPEFFQHEELFDAERETGLPLRIAYAGLWCYADREGRFKWRPRTLCLGILPYDGHDFSRVLDALAARGWVVHYASDGAEYGWLPTFLTHQVVNNRERDSVIPEYDPSTCELVTSTRASRVDDACPTPLVHALGERKGTERKGTEGNGPGAAKPPPARKQSPREALARELSRLLGSSLNPCRKQVGALIASGMTVEQIQPHLGNAIAGMAPWDWSSAVTGAAASKPKFVNGQRVLTSDELYAASKKLRERGE